MKKILSVIVMFFVACSFLLVGCGDDELKNYNPATDAAVSSNGGMTVIKGDYLYYVNGYVDESTLTKDDNVMGKVEYGAIYRTKLVNGEIEKDEDGFLKCTEKIVSKVVGFSNGGFYIHGDYIYYATPYRAYDQQGNFQSARVEFRKIRIDGNSKFDEKVYVTSQGETDLNYTFYEVNDTVYLLTYVNSTIICVNADNGEVIAEISGSTSYIFPEEPTYVNATSAEVQKYVYYTRATKTEDNIPSSLKGNVVCRLDITNGNIEIVNDVDNYTYLIKDMVDNTIYYTKQNAVTSSTTLLNKKILTTSWKSASEVQVANIPFTSYYIHGYNDIMVATNDSGSWLVESGVAQQISTTAYTIVGFNDGYAYYVSDNKLNRFSLDGEIKNGQISVEVATDANKTHKITNDNFVDFDGQRIYVYTEYTSRVGSNKSYYLNYIASDDLEQRFVGKFTDKHLPAGQESETDSDEDVPYID